MNSNSQRSRSRFFGGCIFALVCLSMLSGCTLCQDCGDLDYATYGGAWERTRRDSGRVGSIFDPAGARSATLADRDATSDDEAIRQRGERTGDPAQDRKVEKAKDDPQNEDAEDPANESEPSPSDRSRRNSDPDMRFDPETIKNLDLEDININAGDVLPPDV